MFFMGKFAWKSSYFSLNAMLSSESSNSSLVFEINILSFPSAVSGRMLESETLFHPIGGEVTTCFSLRTSFELGIEVLVSYENMDAALSRWDDKEFIVEMARGRQSKGRRKNAQALQSCSIKLEMTSCKAGANLFNALSFEQRMGRCCFLINFTDNITRNSC